MYVPAHFRETRPEVLHEFMRRHPLATLVARTATGVDANHIPMELAFVDGLPRLRGHVARANPLWREALPAEPVLAIFTGADGYVTPSWYPSKREHGKVVPTWNYAVAHAHGIARAIEDRSWLLDMLKRLTDTQEVKQYAPWRVADAPASYIEKMLGAIVGIEIPIDRLEGKLKASQDEAMHDRRGTVTGLRKRSREDDEATADLVTKAMRPDTSERP